MGLKLLFSGASRLRCQMKSMVGRHATNTRYLSSVSSTVSSAKPKAKPAEEGGEEFRGETAFSMPKVVDPRPITSLNLLAKAERVVKYESFMARLFLGEFDKDFLSFPILLQNRAQYLTLADQYEMIRRTWTMVSRDKRALDVLGFNSLYALSATEMMYAFEAIGAATQQRLPFGNLSSTEKQLISLRNTGEISTSAVSVPDNALDVNHLELNKSIVEELLPLIIHNALSYYAIANSTNENIKDTILNQTEKRPKIGFAYCEPQENLGSLPHIHWDSKANLSADLDSWVISGRKSRLLNDDYEHYIIFCRTSDYPDTVEFPRDLTIDEGIVAFLVPKNMVTVEDDGTDSYGISYQKIKFDNLLLPRDKHELIKSQVRSNLALNIKGCGQVATAAIILGIIKQLLRNTYDFLKTERLGLTDCEAIQMMLSEMTQRIYCLESIVYLTAAMFDGFEAGADMSLECQTSKLIATEYAYEVIKTLRTIYGSRYLVSSTAHDLINVFDAFLDSSLNNRMNLALTGMKMHGEWNADHIRRRRLGPMYVIYNLRMYIGMMKRRRDKVDLSLDLAGYVHPSLKPAAQWMEYCLKRLEYGSELTLEVNGKDVIKKQIDLIRLANIAMNIYSMTAVTSRASHAMCHGIRNNEIDYSVCLSFCKDKFLEVRRIMDELEGHICSSNDYRVPAIHNRNMKFDGYFAMPTIDRII